MMAPRLRTAALATTAIVAVPAIFTVAASYAFVHGTGMQASYPDPLKWQWWLYLTSTPPEWPEATRRFIQTWLKISAGFGAFVAAAPPVAFLTRRRKAKVLPGAGEAPHGRPILRGASNNHGDADWLSIAAAERHFTGAHPRWGFMPVGEAYRPDLDKTASGQFDEDARATWGQGGKAPILGTPLTKGATSGIIIGGSGSYKTMGFTVPAMFTWRGSMVIMDPSAQVAPMAQELRENMGQTVAVIDYRRPHLGSFNVLACIDMAGHAPEVQIDEFVSWCFAGAETDKPDKDDFWAISAKELCACLLTDLLADDTIPPHQRSLGEWRSRIALPEPELKKLLTRIYGAGRHPGAQQVAGTLMKTPEKTFGSIYKVATSNTKWLTIPGFAELLSGDSFDPQEITQGNLTVIIQAGNAMATNPAVGRVIIGTLAGIMRRAEGRTETPVPFILDEMAQLGYMQVLAQLRDQGRKSGVALFPMWQSIGQIEKTWGKEGVRDWYASADWRMYLAVNDPATAEEVAKEGGTYTAVTRTEGTSKSRQGIFGSSTPTYGQNQNLAEQRRDLISAYEVMNRVRPDEALIKVRGLPLLRCGRPLWFRREEMLRAIRQDTYRRQTELA